MRYLTLLLATKRSMVTIARVAELVDAADSKSAARKGVPVQVRPLVPAFMSFELSVFVRLIIRLTNFQVKA